MPYRANAQLQDLFAEKPLRESCRRITKRVTEQIKEGAARRSPVAPVPQGMTASQFAGSRGRTPGTLKASWETGLLEETVAPTGIERFAEEAYTEDPIAPHVEWSTRPHLIRPRADRGAASVVSTTGRRRLGTEPEARLRFIGRNGRVTYAAEVHHPGTQGQHMMRDSLAETDATWADGIGAEEVDRWAREQAALVR